MKNFIKKPIKEYNIIDMGILTIGALATIPVGFFIFCKGFDILESITNKTTEYDDEPLEPEIVPETEED